MNFDHLLQLFVVKEKSFFPLFVKSAENISAAAALLLQQAQESDPDERRILAHRIKERETEGDTITHQIVDVLMNAYITPFDRDDIHDLAEGLDGFLDSIRDSSKKIAIYQPKDSSKKLIEIADYINKAAGIMLEATKHFDTMRKDAKELDKLCDHDIYESYMSNLFEYEKDAIELVKKKNIAQALEDTSDVAKAVSSKIRSIVVKNS